MFVQATDYGNNGMSGGAFFLWIVLIYIIFVIPLYAIFTKAGRPGWSAFIPIYSTIVLLEVVGRPIWWIILLFIPIVNLVVFIIVMNDLSKSFGHAVGFTLGLIFLSWIFEMILAFGSSTYRGPSAQTAAMAPPPPPPPAMPPG